MKTPTLAAAIACSIAMLGACYYDAGFPERAAIIRVADGPGAAGQWTGLQGDTIFYFHLWHYPTPSPFLPDIAGNGLHGPRNRPKTWQRFSVAGDQRGDTLFLELNYGPDWSTGIDVRVSFTALFEAGSGRPEVLRGDIEGVGAVRLGRPPG